ncbi:MAG: pectate lyase-like adhesive domain-containing protein [Bacilli bacterium]
MCIPFAGVNAATGVANEAELTAALEAGGDIELTSSITVTNPLIVSKDVTIKGNGNTLTSTIAAGGGNRTIISSLNSATLTLENITLKNSPKYE